MISPFDNSKLRPRGAGYSDESGGFWISSESLANLRAIRTREMRLSDLGFFPLAEPESLNYKVLRESGYEVPELLRRSNIPVYYNERGDIYVPAAGIPVCRYFEVFTGSTSGADDELQSGLLALDSFTGGSSV